jgi:hypothetical protein
MKSTLLSAFALLALAFMFALSSGRPGGDAGDYDEEVVKATVLPPVFDLRTTGRITSIHLQPSSGCWASAAMTCLETAWKTAGFGDFTLSDNHLKNCHGFLAKRGLYGNPWTVTAYFTNGMGPVLRNGADTGCAGPAEPVAVITGARYLPRDPLVIKNSILNFGAVFSMMYYRDAWLDPVLHTYCYQVNSDVNHVVALVGWNDTLTTAGGRGAWIAQNSRGNKWADRGFFYVSYADSGILRYNAAWPSWMPYDDKVKICYYDTMGSYRSFGYRDSVCCGLVKFTAGEDVEIFRVGTCIAHPKTRISGKIYASFDPSKKIPGTVLADIRPVVCRFAGYYSFDLDKPVSVGRGSDFYVMLRYVSPADTTPLPIETFVPAYARPHITSGKCWVNPDQEKWPSAWYEAGAASPWRNYDFDLCIKAYVRMVH